MRKTAYLDIVLGIVACVAAIIAGVIYDLPWWFNIVTFTLGWNLATPMRTLWEAL